MAVRFNPPPGWPVPPADFTPGPGWQPDPSWPPAPDGWQLWVADDQDAPATSGLPAGYPPAPALTGFPEAPPMYPPRQPSGTDGLATAALVLGLLGFVWICAVLGIVFGIIARNRIRRTFERGRGQATAGIVLGSIWLGLYVAVIILAIVLAVRSSSNSAAPSASASSAAGQTVDPFTLRTGDCFDNPAATIGQIQQFTSVVRTTCTQPHNAQIFATFHVSGGLLSYPGDAAMRGIASSGCTARAPAALDSTKVTDSMRIRFLYPVEGSWLAGVRTISCEVYSSTPTLTSSVLKG